MANNSAEHRTAEEILNQWECEDHDLYRDEIIAAMHEFAAQQVKAKDDELVRVTKLLEAEIRYDAGEWSSDPKVVDKAWNDYKTKNEIQ